MSPAPLISIVMPAYNAERYIGAAIDSVLAQTWPNWELIVVDDGSTDRTAEIVRAYGDPRITLLQQANHGIGHARNTALEAVRGTFLCFLDSDDLLPPTSIASRAERMIADPGVDFCDGKVVLMDQELRRELRRYVPTFRGRPFHELVRLNGSCFFGITWMIRWSPGLRVRFNTRVSHAEDILFYLELPHTGRYDHVDDVVLTCRRRAGSSMSDLEGLERSYHYIAAWLRARPAMTSVRERVRFGLRIRRIMAGSYWEAGRYGRALRALLIVPSGVPPQSVSSTSV
jgi:hypothetical protein